ncbi:tripartite tricarboxylate transporter TctB family protein [Pseudothermotoga sp.]
MPIADLILGFVLVFISFFVLLYSRKFPRFVVRGVRLPGPSFFPRVLAVLLLIFAAYIFVEYFRLRKRKSSDEKHPVDAKSLLNVLWISLMVLFFFPLANLMGTFVILTTLSFLLMVVLKSKWYEALVFSLSVALIVHLIFSVIFKIPLPEGLLFAKLG